LKDKILKGKPVHRGGWIAHCLWAGWIGDDPCGPFYTPRPCQLIDCENALNNTLGFSLK